MLYINGTKVSHGNKWNTTIYYYYLYFCLFCYTESEQLTGSFKARGAFNKVLHLLKENTDFKTRGVYTASTGNHGLGCVSILYFSCIKSFKISVINYKNTTPPEQPQNRRKKEKQHRLPLPALPNKKNEKHTDTPIYITAHSPGLVHALQ